MLQPLVLFSYSALGSTWKLALPSDATRLTGDYLHRWQARLENRRKPPARHRIFPFLFPAKICKRRPHNRDERDIPTTAFHRQGHSLKMSPLLMVAGEARGSTIAPINAKYRSSGNNRAIPISREISEAMALDSISESLHGPRSEQYECDQQPAAASRTHSMLSLVERFRELGDLRGDSIEYERPAEPSRRRG